MTDPRARAALRSRIVGHGNEAPDQLLANPGNYRRHPKEQLEALGGSLSELGWIREVLVNVTTGHVVDGHARVELALVRGEASVPITYVELSPEEERLALAVLDPIAAMAYQDEKALAELLSGIQTQDADLAGFLERLVPTQKVTAEVDTSLLTAPSNPITKVGDLIVMGERRLVCGDSTKPEPYEALFGTKGKAHAMWTDPPYNVAYLGSPGTKRRAIANDDQTPEDFREFLGAVFDRCLERLQAGGATYVAAPTGPQFLDFGLVLRPRGIWRQTLVWVKNAHVLGRSDYHYRQEVIFEGTVPVTPFPESETELVSYGWKPGAPHRWHGGRSLNTVFEEPKPQASADHPTMKPVNLIRRMVEASTQKGETVLDPFAGSGSTMIACEEIGRQARLIELDPAYCDNIAERYERATGRPAERVTP